VDCCANEERGEDGKAEGVVYITGMLDVEWNKSMRSWEVWWGKRG